MTDQTTAVAAQTPEERIAQDITKFDHAQAKLEKFRHYKTITINGVADVDGRKMARENRLEVKRERVELEKLRKGLVDDAVQYQRAVNAAAKVYIEEMEAIEDHLAAEEEKIERLEEEERTREAREKEQEIAGRKKVAFDAGFLWNGMSFQNKFGFAFTEQFLVTASAQEFMDHLADIQRESQALQVKADAEAAAEAERKRIADEEAAKQRAIAEENERKALELLEKEKAIQKEQEAQAAATAEKMRKLDESIDNARANELVALGMYREPNESTGLSTVYLFKGGEGHGYFVNQLHNIEDWEAELSHNKALVQKRDADIEAARIAAERQTILDNRVKCLRAVGWVNTIDNKGLVLSREDEDGAAGSSTYVWFANIIDMPQSDYEALIGYGEVELSRRELAKNEQLRKEGEERERLKHLKRLGEDRGYQLLQVGYREVAPRVLRLEHAEGDSTIILDQLGELSVEEFDAFYQYGVKDKAIKDAAEAERVRIEVQARMSDLEKFTVWTKAIIATKPELTSEIGKHAVERLCDHVQDMTFGVQKDLK